MQFLSLDQWLDSEHRVRIVWQYVESLDLTELYEQIRAVEGHVGRDAVDPRILFALWMFATIEGVSSARRLNDLTKRDIPYMWICGGVSVNHRLVSEFRAQHGALLERLMIDSIGVLIHQNLVTLETVAQDGMRVRANAGTDSFRRSATLAEALKQAEEHVETLKAKQQADPAGDNRRKQAAQQRAAEDRLKRIKQAQDHLAEVKAQREKLKRDTEQTRASTTDPDARHMKMPCGGFRPALNVQFATDGETRLIVGVEVNNQGSDAGLMAPMHAKLSEDYAKVPENYLVDGPYATCDDVTQLEEAGTAVHAPLSKEAQQLAAGKDPYARKRDDNDQMAAFRARMGTPAAKELYKQRPSIAEFPNADCRNRALQQFRVRGALKAKSQAMWHVLSFNFLRFLNLGYLEVVIKG